jgi:hypothetical protein
MTVRQHLEDLGSCSEALAWLGERTAKQAWEECPRADWLMWWAARTPINPHTQIVLAACQCARRALRFVSRHEHRPRLVIEAAEQWTKEPTIAYASAAAEAAAWAMRAAAEAAGAEHLILCPMIRLLLVQPWSEIA